MMKLSETQYSRKLVNFDHFYAPPCERDASWRTLERCRCRRISFCPVAQDTQLPRDDEERRLIAIFDDCRAEEHAAADQLLHPGHSLLYPAYMRLVDALRVIRLKCNEQRLAVRAHREKTRDEGK